MGYGRPRREVVRLQEIARNTRKLILGDPGRGRFGAPRRLALRRRAPRHALLLQDEARPEEPQVAGPGPVHPQQRPRGPSALLHPRRGRLFPGSRSSSRCASSGPSSRATQTWDPRRRDARGLRGHRPLGGSRGGARGEDRRQGLPDLRPDGGRGAAGGRGLGGGDVRLQVQAGQPDRHNRQERDTAGRPHRADNAPGAAGVPNGARSTGTSSR